MRAMDEGDIDFALRLTDREGWEYTRPEFERLFRMPHRGCIVWEDGGPRGFVTSVQFGRSAVIGHLVVEGSARGRNVGRKLLRASLDELDSAGVSSVIVFSTGAGERLYESFGFRQCRVVVSYGLASGRLPGTHRCPPLREEDIGEVCSLDEEAFGDDRSDLLKGLLAEHPDLCFKTVRDGRITGFIFARRTPLGGDFGPWNSVTESPEDALGLVQSVLSRFEGQQVDAGFFEDSSIAMSVVRSFESVRRFTTNLMILGEARYAPDRQGALGIAGFELG